ncbi:MAG: DUF1566 domain-containing protein [Actinomycetota bacterium]|nr:DUF1566 domain-containing protein [Actinomycetota bacterium]
MRSQRQQALLGAFAVSALVLSACSSGSSESASPTAATPAVESAAPEASAAAVATAGDYKVGDTGPGGGIVFYDAGSVQPWGRFLEAGPELAATQWCNDSEFDVAGTQTTIGSGKENTDRIAEVCGSGAANSVSDYDGGGKTDWFLPSKDELNELYEQRDSVGGFGTEFYWNSSQFDPYNAWYQDFTDGFQGASANESDAFGVRPVRAF